LEKRGRKPGKEEILHAQCVHPPLVKPHFWAQEEFKGKSAKGNILKKDPKRAIKQHLKPREPTLLALNDLFLVPSWSILTP